jgi:hypothetical protein
MGRPISTPLRCEILPPWHWLAAWAEGRAMTLEQAIQYALPEDTD